MNNGTLRQIAAISLVFTLVTASVAQVQQLPPKPFPYPEKLEYRIEWRLITAGTARIDLSRMGTNWESKLDLESAGMVTKLYKVADNYRVLSGDKFCGINATLDAQEGKRHRFSTLTFDNSKHKVQYEEHDFLKNQINSRVTDVAPCTHEILGALESLRMMHVEPGRTVMLPITDGKKTVMARIEAQGKETLSLDNNKFQTIRYEAFLFDNVLYQRRGRLWIWMTDDASRLPVQIRVRMGFPIGSITLTLNKVERI